MTSWNAHTLSDKFFHFQRFTFGVSQGLVVDHKSALGWVFPFRVYADYTRRGFRIVPNNKVDASMKRSIENVSTWLKNSGSRHNINQTVFETTRLCLSMPSICETSGPSAGVAIASACVSHFNKRELRSDIAVTGALRADGFIRAIGSLREKLEGAARSDIYTVLIPESNASELETVPAQTRAQLRIVSVRRIDDVIEELSSKRPLQIGYRPLTPSPSSLR